jgi:hypothetical protein
MKTLAIILLAAMPCIACPENSVDMKNGVCAAVPIPAVQITAEASTYSDEKPRRGAQPAWETGEVKAEIGRPQRFEDDAPDIPNGGVPQR